ncbi:MAG: hypothetical protein RBT60_10410 [Candidatus Krumholzibacteria bacterium]|jgi:hypothetical protein|nr:hypothetical protein [Candidatus Krumholzibacteria bacterium]
MKKLTISLIVLSLAVAMTGLALAKESPRSVEGTPGFRAEAVRAYMEGFEGAFPPDGWSQIITVPSNTWEQDFVATPFEGLAHAHVLWQDVTEQYEVLSFDYLIDTAAEEDHLVFATMGSMYWSSNGNFTVEVDGTEVYNFYNEFTAGNFVWDLVDVDLSAYNGQTVTISFIYAGLDGADHHFDAVSIDAGAPPPPPPPTNDLCENAIDLVEQDLETFTVDLCQANNSYNAADSGASCTGYSSNGNDVVYKIYLTVGQEFTASQQGSHDSAIWLATDCADLSGTCVVGADDTVTGGIETITYTADVEGWYYLIIDGYSGCSLTTVTVVFPPIATENTNWSNVKAMYR